jgi:hypothetical protein
MSMYARTNRCYNERGSRSNYVRSSIPHCSCFISDIHAQHNNELWGLKAEFWEALENCKQRLLASSCPSVRHSSWNNSAPTWPIFMKFNIWEFFSKNVKKIQVSLKFDKHNGCVTWRPKYIYDNTSLSSSRTRNVSDKIFMPNNIFPEYRAAFDIMWKNYVKPDRPRHHVEKLC